ncbi:non-homologous end-joining DNA ligase [uncultured Jatrophihabitans sp.]|uniref:non-homologous end-joining DNA ligase n=1 Tax=uncultured Jatrophihabitans sp. TaxID=1610747 RepID=UPI0035CB8746
MLATAAAALPHGEGWAFEFKWDGVRALIDVRDDTTPRLTSRRGNDVSAGYPELVAQASGVGDALLDGEIVAFVDGRPSFGRLQTRMHLRAGQDVARAAHEAPVTYVVFDVLRRFGVDLTARPYRERRATLERFAAEHEGWTLSPSFDDGPATEQVAHEHGLEGVVAKRVDSIYQPGRRTEDWRKLRFVRAGDFAVIGWEASPEHPNTLSSLLLAVVDGDQLRFAGKVGSGLSGRAAATVQKRLTARASSAVPGVPRSIGGRHMHWVEPEQVVEVEFASWTDDRRLRHPVFRGLREDKRVEEARGDG